jgi:hypothetical protein
VVAVGDHLVYSMGSVEGCVMTDLRQAAQQALEALEDIFGKNKVDVGAITALRAALAEPERPPLTDEEIDEMWRQSAAKEGLTTAEFVRDCARAIERKVRGE